VFITSTLICICATITLFSTLYKISFVYFRAFLAMKLCVKFEKETRILTETAESFIRSDIDSHKLLIRPGLNSEIDSSVLIVKIKAWFELRQFVLNKTLPFFYEIANPIVSLLVLSVFCFSVFWTHHVFVVFDGSPVSFFESIFADNTRFILLIFTFSQTAATLFILHSFLRPYRRQREQIQFIKKVKTMLVFHFEQAGIYGVKNHKNYNDKELSGREKKLRAVISVCDHVISTMQQMKADPRCAPKLVGVRMTHSKLLAIRGYAFGFIAVFVGAVFRKYIEDYADLLDNE